MTQKTWIELYEASTHLTKPAHVKALISTENSAEIKQLMLTVIRNFLKKGEVHVGLKTYINKELRNDMTEKMLSQSPTDDDTLESWSQKIFEEEKFGMIFNFLEEYSNTFSEKAATIVHPLLKLAGLPLQGLSFLFFMGNYGFTPFGIHKENIGEEGILFHLGPGKKLFYMWDDPKYNAITHNTQVFHNIEEMLPKAQCYELEPGDAIYIPHQVYHVANTEEFSVSFVMDYINPPMDTFENELIELTAAEQLNTQRTYQVPLQMDSSRSSWNALLNSESIHKKVEIALQRKILALQSNGGIARKSKIIDQFQFPNQSFSIQGKTIFPLLVDEQSDDDDVVIFARGHRIHKKKHPKLLELIKKMNDQELVSINEIKELLEPDWDMIEIYGFIGELLSTETVHLEIEAALEN
jgi:hypothetical protein